MRGGRGAISRWMDSVDCLWLPVSLGILEGIISLYVVKDYDVVTISKAFTARMSVSEDVMMSTE